MVGVENGSMANVVVIEQWSDGSWTSQHWQIIDNGAAIQWTDRKRFLKL
ncbi:hypothetical protein QFZ81_002097 [Paenibacillus sp. V4I9]|nr:hypothetical protein [Paenibacillus sp. V4I9]MDQ0887009.1 hypothetical protein [Paenibacillus sp. V4I9]